jgi:hypothetical protein
MESRMADKLVVAFWSVPSTILGLLILRVIRLWSLHPQAVQRTLQFLLT